MEDLNLYIILVLSGIIIGGLLIVSVLFGMMNRIPQHAAVPMYADGYSYQQNYGLRFVMTLIAMILLYLFLTTQQPTSENKNTLNQMPITTERVN